MRLARLGSVWPWVKILVSNAAFFSALIILDIRVENDNITY